MRNWHACMAYRPARSIRRSNVTRTAFRWTSTFQLTLEEASLLKSQSVTSSWGGRRKPPYAFTEHGAVQAANVLRSNRAITMSVHIVRAFVRTREALAGHRDLARRLQGLERTLLALDLETDAQFEEVFVAIRSLMQPPLQPKRPIGFVWPEDEKPRARDAATLGSARCRPGAVSARAAAS